MVFETLVDFGHQGFIVIEAATTRWFRFRNLG